MSRPVARLRRSLAVAAALAACAARRRAPPAGPASSAAPAPPRLVVLVVIDQLPTWVFERDRGLYRRGLARLVRDGGVVAAAEIPYANTFTAAGHASLGTGTTPSVHGILGNTWYRRAERRARAAELDPDAPTFAVGDSHGGALGPDDGVSARALRVDGLADALRAATDDRARSITIALKARVAALAAGRRPELAVWYEPAAGGMTTSRAYARAAPRWLAELARRRPATRFFGQRWDAADPALLARVTGIADAAAGEGGVHGLGAAFPHDLARSDAPARAFQHTPFSDELVVETALAALDQLALGADDVPDLLVLGFSAHDYASHVWGQESWETLDLTLRLDALLGTLFDTLDARLGRGGWAAVVTSDHGATPMVERSAVPGARRIDPQEIIAAAEAALARRLGEGPWVEAVLSSNVYLAPAFAGLPDATRREALAAAGEAIARIPQIAAAGPNDAVAGECAARAGIARALCLSVVDGESGELYVVPAAGSLISMYPTGTHHDAPFDDNRRVPIFVLAPGLAARAGTGTLLQVAPTVAALLGIPPPPAATEPPLFGLPPARPGLHPPTRAP